LSEQPIKIAVAKIYKIDEAGNVDVERSWILSNQTQQDVDMSKVDLYVGETVDALANARAKDSSGSLDIRQERKGSTVKLAVSLESMFWVLSRNTRLLCNISFRIMFTNLVRCGFFPI